MARTPRDAKPEAHVVTDADTPGLPAMVDALNQEAAMQAAYNEDRDLLNRLVGRLELAGGIQKLLTVVSLKDLAHIKENKLYRAFAGQKGADVDGNEIADVGTWEGFCLSVGTTRQKADEDLTNLKVFGEDALKSLNNIGVGYRELRKLRKLPEEDRTVVVEQVEVAVGDKDAILSLIDDMAAKHAKEKEALAKKSEEALGERDAARRVGEDKQAQINKLRQELDEAKEKRLTMTPDANLKLVRRFATECAQMLETDIAALHKHLATLRDMGRELGEDQTAFMAGTLGQSLARLADVRHALELPEVAAGPAMPEWLKDDS